MRSRAVRITLTLLAFAAAGAAAYSYLTTEKRIDATLARASAFTYAHQAATRAVFEIGTAQQAYVAVRQDEAFWFQKVSTSIASLRAALADLERATASSEAHAALAAVAVTLEDFDKGDRRVRGYVTTGQRLLASDIIFSDGLRFTSSVLNDLDRAAEHARHDVAAARASAVREQMIAAGIAVGVSLLVVLVLVPVSTQPAAGLPVAASEPLSESALAPDPRATAAPVVDETAAAVAVLQEATTVSTHPERTALNTAPPPGLELGDLARICTELARLSDSTIMPEVLERTASALNASGLVLWVVDAERKELIPIAVHGYAPNVLSRLGTLPVGSENATASAFRTGLVQTVRANEKSNGAIAAPLVSPAGCLGVMAVEMRDGGEREPARRAAASIVAAQLATIVGPPATPAEERDRAAL